MQNFINVKQKLKVTKGHRKDKKRRLTKLLQQITFSLFYTNDIMGGLNEWPYKKENKKVFQALFMMTWVVGPFLHP